MGTHSPTEFYKERGLVRTSITLDRETIHYLDEKAKENSVPGQMITQGEVVILLCKLLEQDSNFKDQFNGLMDNYKIQKAKKREALREKKKKIKKLMLAGKLDHLLD